ncbi:MAG TPA: glutaminase A [Leptospiraceae bacterium]|nr:glutaminase A [Spirochaetaceae bacterium]HBS03942.1 glutaminase A [Leptospiraceae bacterium]
MKTTEAAVQKAYETVRKSAPSGEVATYIPELARINPDLLAISVIDLQGNQCSYGDAETQFTLQSVSKAFSLALVLQENAAAVFDTVGFEPTGNPFFSMLPMESEHGKPRNPFVNSGAIAVSSMIPGGNAKSSYANFLGFLEQICEEKPVMDVDTHRSESETGYRNRAMANFLKQYGWIEDVDTAVETYFMQCSTLTNVRQLARMGLFLANRGIDPLTQKRIVDEESCRAIVTLMTTCGTYDYAGRVAIEIGLPCKSGVSGGILAIVPGKMSIAAFAPRLGTHGNSEAGMELLKLISEELSLSLFQ